MPTPDLSTAEKRGAYLATLASCADCHTPMDERGQFIEGSSSLAAALLCTRREQRAAANITPAVNGIPYYNEALFLEVIRTGRVREREISDLCPWGPYRNMTDEDLKAIFAFLKTLKPVDHFVDNAMPRTKCATCNLRTRRRRAEQGADDHNSLQTPSSNFGVGV